MSLAQAAIDASQAIPSTPLELVTSSTGATKAVLGILVLLSLISWFIIFAKWFELRRVSGLTQDFAHRFGGAQTVDQAAEIARRTRGPHAVIMERAIRFIEETTPALAGTPDRAARLSGSQVEALRLVLDAETTSERDRLSRWVPWLATIGSVSPLIGLLGTVLGVIEAFIGIAQKGSGNIGAVAPGVAEALIATAAALAVAIPAVFAYNIFASGLNKIEGELESFGSELIALMVREGRI
ncbi:MAG TPA: MotA/TolQ/ExbB proton channel family protein [Gemmatimonadaceae bacterium]|nr:MotA/TolQ/ExbB proton channel family protein [Gemmatimonadaceae bacterium]